MKSFACAFTGHRPAKFSFGYDEEDERCIRLKTEMARKIKELIESGVTAFYSGMAQGTDQWGAQIVLDMKRKYPDIRLIAVLPCDKQSDNWPRDKRERYFNLLAECDEILVLNTSYTPQCMAERNRYLVDHAGVLLAVYDGGETGGTAYTVRCARERKREIIIIRP